MSASGTKQICDSSRIMNIQLIVGGHFDRIAVVKNSKILQSD